MITNIKIITRDYIVEDTNYYIIRFNLEGITEEDKERFGYADVMYGTMDHKFVGDDGRITKPVALIHLAADTTIAKAIQKRLDYCEAAKMVDKLVAEGKITI